MKKIAGCNFLFYVTQQKERKTNDNLNKDLTKNNILEDLKDKVKWMVFKVKQRAKTKYNNLLVGKSEKEDLFSYNWPYDYFSLIEFAKMDSTITYGEIPLATVQTTDPNSSVLPPSLPADISLTNTTTTAETRETARASEAALQSNIETLKREK